MWQHSAPGVQTRKRQRLNKGGQSIQSHPAILLTRGIFLPTCRSPCPAQGRSHSLGGLAPLHGAAKPALALELGFPPWSCLPAWPQPGLTRGGCDGHCPGTSRWLRSGAVCDPRDRAHMQKLLPAGKRLSADAGRQETSALSQLAGALQTQDASIKQPISPQAGAKAGCAQVGRVQLHQLWSKLWASLGSAADSFHVGHG